MECPACKDIDAYVGFSSVDCLNPKCVHFKESYLEEKLKESKEGFDALLERLGLDDDFSDILSGVWFRGTDYD